MTTPQALLNETDLLLLDFDGPVTRLLPPPQNIKLTNQLRHHALSVGVRLDHSNMITSDHLAIVRSTFKNSPEMLLAIEEEATRLEIAAARSSRPTPGIGGLLQELWANKVRVAIITNNSPECARAFLGQQGLEQFVLSIIGRDARHIERMKPNPWMLNAAIALHHAERPVMIGDSVSDVESARAAHVPIIGLAKDAKREKELSDAGASCTVRTMSALMTLDDAP